VVADEMRKGRATVRWETGLVQHVEIHWHEAHGVGRREIKVKGAIEDAT
jgi:hypothetical protein